MKKPLKVLIVEDNPEDAVLLLAELRRAGFAPIWTRVDTEADFLAGIRQAPDIIVSDYSMPSFTGLQAAELLESSGLDIPFILVSGTVGEEVAVEAMKHGATDYMLKDRLVRLGSAVERALRETEAHKQSRRAAEALRESEALYRELFEHAHDLIQCVRSDGHFVYVNPAWQRALGYAPEELADLTLSDILHPDGRSSALTRFEHLLHGRDAGAIEAEFITKSGRTLLVEGTASHRPGANGQTVARCFFRDITERRRSEDRLRLLTSAVLQSQESILITDANLDAPGPRIVFANPAFTRMTGYSEAEVLGKSPRILQGPRTDRAVLRRLREDLAQGRVFQGEAVNYRKDGTDYILEWQIAPIRADDGKIIHFVAVQRDITARKQIEARIQEQAALLDVAHEAILVKDLEGRILYWNKGAERSYGWTADEALGRYSTELLRHDPAKFADALAILLSKGEWQGEMIKRTKDDREIAAEVRWTLVRDTQGRPKSFLSIDNDITERKKLEQQFLRAQRMESIGTLAGGIAHDLNNLLAPISMGIDLLKELSPNPQSLSVIATMGRSAKRGAELVRQVLSFARGVEGSRVPLQANHIIEEVESIAQNTFPKNIAIEFVRSADPWLVLASPTQLNQVLLNLCVNARDAMPDGGRLEISAHNVEIDSQYATMNRGVAPGRYVEIRVTDSGAGIPPEIVERIFEPFFTTKEIGKGTGLGLSTVQGIVRGHGGFVNVYSEPGRGSTFKVYLPAAPQDAASTHLSPALDRPPRGNGELLLVVDDEPSILQITRQTLETFGYRVVTAEDGAHAIAIYATHRAEIAAVLTDMMMPVMDGPALIAALHRIDPRLVIIAASGLNAHAQVLRATNTGVKHFLAKPYSAEIMLALIKTALDERFAPDPPESPRPNSQESR